MDENIVQTDGIMIVNVILSSDYVSMLLQMIPLSTALRHRNSIKSKKNAKLQSIFG